MFKIKIMLRQKWIDEINTFRFRKTTKYVYVFKEMILNMNDYSRVNKLTSLSLEKEQSAQNRYILSKIKNDCGFKLKFYF